MHGTGQSWLETWTPEKVAAAPDPALAFAEYAQQVLGVPWATLNDYKILRKEAKEFFEHYPQADWITLCRVVQYCKKTRRRPERVWKIIGYFRYAWRDRALPELDQRNHVEPNIEERINAALETETSEGWRRRLIGAAGPENRRLAITEWEALRR